MLAGERDGPGGLAGVRHEPIFLAGDPSTGVEVEQLVVVGGVLTHPPQPGVVADVRFATHPLHRRLELLPPFRGAAAGVHEGLNAGHAGPLGVVHGNAVKEAHNADPGITVDVDEGLLDDPEGVGDHAAGTGARPGVAMLRAFRGGVLELALEAESGDEPREADVDGACFGLGAAGEQQSVVAVDEPADKAAVDAAILAAEVMHDHAVTEAGVHVAACAEADEAGGGLQHPAELVLPEHGQHVLRHTRLSEEVLLGGTEGVDVGVKCGHVDAHCPKAILHPAHDLVVPLMGVAPFSEHEVPVDCRVGVQEALKWDDKGGKLNGVHRVVGGDEAHGFRWRTNEDFELAEGVVMTAAGATLRVACGSVVLRAAAGDEVGGLGDDVDGV